jgi:hypothetical protein
LREVVVEDRGGHGFRSSKNFDRPDSLFWAVLGIVADLYARRDIRGLLAFAISLYGRLECGLEGRVKLQCSGAG